MRAFTYPHVVTFDETNLVGNVYFAHFLHWQGRCREDFLFRHAPDVLEELRAGTLTLVTVSCSMDFVAECFAFDRLDIRMSLRAAHGHRIHMDFDVLRSEQLVARGDQVVACMVRTSGEMVPREPPAALRDALSRFA